MAEFDKKKVFEVIQKDITPPGHFQNVLARRDGWIGVFCYDFEGPRWNKLIPVPGESGEVPEEVLDLASEIGGDVSIYGETGFVDETIESLGLENMSTAFEMTYLVPDDLPEENSLPDVEFRRTSSSEKVREDFMEIFRKAFGEKQDDGSFEIGDAMREGVERIIEEKALGVNRISFVGYLDGEAVCTGSLISKEGEGFMFNVASHPDHRGKGLGSAVTVKLNGEAKNRGLENVFIGTQPNTDVEKFYRGIGCKEVFKVKCVEIDLEEL